MIDKHDEESQEEADVEEDHTQQEGDEDEEVDEN